MIWARTESGGVASGEIWMAVCLIFNISEWNMGLEGDAEDDSKSWVLQIAHTHSHTVG